MFVTHSQEYARELMSRVTEMTPTQDAGPSAIRVVGGTGRITFVAVPVPKLHADRIRPHNDRFIFDHYWEESWQHTVNEVRAYLTNMFWPGQPRAQEGKSDGATPEVHWPENRPLNSP